MSILNFMRLYCTIFEIFKAEVIWNDIITDYFLSSSTSSSSYSKTESWDKKGTGTVGRNSERRIPGNVTNVVIALDIDCMFNVTQTISMLSNLSCRMQTCSVTMRRSQVHTSVSVTVCSNAARECVNTQTSISCTILNGLILHICQCMKSYFPHLKVRTVSEVK